MKILSFTASIKIIILAFTCMSLFTNCEPAPDPRDGFVGMYNLEMNCQGNIQPKEKNFTIDVSKSSNNKKSILIKNLLTTEPISSEIEGDGFKLTPFRLMIKGPFDSTYYFGC